MRTFVNVPKNGSPRTNLGSPTRLLFNPMFSHQFTMNSENEFPPSVEVTKKMKKQLINKLIKETTF